MRVTIRECFIDFRYSGEPYYFLASGPLENLHDLYTIKLLLLSHLQA